MATFTRLKLHRMRSGLTQTQAAEQLQISVKQLSNLENRRNPLTKDLAQLLSLVYSTPLEEILKDY